MRVVLAGGGTGGHVIPALAIANQLRSCYDANILFIGTARGIETRLVPKAGYGLKLIEVGALKKVTLATRLKTLFDLPRAIAASSRILREFRPDVVISVGGYASGPAVVAAALSSIPSVIFEPNYVPGFANRVAAVMASAAAVHFPATCDYFRDCHVTGVPVRNAFFQVPPRPANARPTALVFGGSQGARAINQAVIGALPQLRAALPELLILHQTGERDYDEAQRVYLMAGISAEIFPFIENMPEAFSRADLLICRSGASTVAEITAAGKPAIFVPFPHAADDHQRRNAEALVSAGASELLPESELTPQRLSDLVLALLRDRQRLAAMSQAARSLSHRNAAGEIAALAARFAGVPAKEVAKHIS